MSTKINYHLLAFYKFVQVPDAKSEVKKLKLFCTQIGMKGRIYIGEEGINAQCSVNDGQKQALLLYFDAHPLFKDIPDIEEKSTQITSHQFPKMIVRYKKEIVVLGEIFKTSEIEKSKYKISTEKFKKILDDENTSDYLILDMRNNYEYELGHFKNALPAGTMSFRETENFISDYRKKAGDKNVIMYCTGGIRCEKLAVLLENSGMKEVKQLDGGVIKYTNLHNDGNWLGNLYTFDDRVSTYIGDSRTHTVIGKCHYTGAPAEIMFNCRYGDCNKQFIALPKEYKKYLGFCSQDCIQESIENFNIRNADFDKLDYQSIRNNIKNGKADRKEMKKIISDNFDENYYNMRENTVENGSK